MWRRRSGASTASDNLGEVAGDMRFSWQDAFDHLPSIARLFLPALLYVTFSLDLAPSHVALLWCVLFTFFMWINRFDPINVIVAFGLPWLAILLFSALDISEYSRGISIETVFVVVASLASVIFFIPDGSSDLHLFEKSGGAQFEVHQKIFLSAVIFFGLFSVLNVVLAGYVPFVQLLMEGDSGYMDFGVKGLYGLFNAYANALGLTAYYIYITKGGKIYRNTFIAILVVFFVFVTRQNMISLMFEAFVVHNMIIRRVPPARIGAAFALVLLCFSFMGDLRVGEDIADIAQIKPEYRWIPTPLLWLYSYCYFNVLNLDNIVTTYVRPELDGASLAQLLPSFMRPTVDEDLSILEVSNFTVDSFASPLYRDFGIVGLLLVILLVSLMFSRYVRWLRAGDVYMGVAGYAVLHFCFLFSFFVNFWFYLPIIFQLFFFWVFGRYLFKSGGNDEKHPDRALA